METLVVTPPVGYPVSLDSIKSYLRLGWADDDAMVQDLIAAATDWVEHGLGRKLLTQTLSSALYLPDLLMTPLSGVIGTFNGYAIRLPWVPVQSVTKVEIETQISTWVTLTPVNDYLSDAPDGSPTKVYLATSALAQWAVALNYPGNQPRVRVTYITGYGADPALVPGGIRRNISQVATWMYSNRDGQSIPDTLLDLTHKVWSL